MSIDLKQVRFKLLNGLLLLMALTLVACQGQAAVTPEPEEAEETPVATEAAEPTEAPADTPTPEEAMVTPSVTVEDQEIEDGTVTIAEVVSDGPGWLVVHADDDGPGPVIGQTAVSDGSNSDVVVEIDTDQATETLHAMLHTDDGTQGKYEFPDADPSVQVDGQVVNEPFTATGTMEEEAMVTPSVTVEDQEIEDGTVTIAEVVSDGPGWLVVHADDDGPGPVIGQTAVSDGSNSDVVVEIDTDQATETLHAMLHSDDGTQGEYEFPDADPPVQVDGQVVNEPFSTAGMMDEEAMASTVTMVDSAFEPAELTVSAGTTVQWVNEGDLVHTVTADDDSFDSGDMESGDTFEFTFDEPGEYPYYCVYHGDAGGVGMAGTIIVTEG